MSAVKQLYQLQLLDSEWQAKTARLQEVTESLGESRDLIRAREAVAETEGDLTKLQAQMRDLELEIAAVETKLKGNQDRLYSGRVRNPKELSSLQEEAAALRRRRAELEDRQLEFMIEIEDQEAELSERQARLGQIEATWREDQAALSSEKEQLEARLTELEEQCGSIRGRLGAVDLSLYDDLRDHLGGVAVVQLKQGICQMCGVNVPTGVVRAVERGEGPHYCPTCNRMLFGG